MNYEMAVLAALVQLDAPNTPKIAQTTGISERRVRTAIDNLKSTMNVAIVWSGPNRNGHYSIESWGVFETGAEIRRQASSFNLAAYKSVRHGKSTTVEQKRNYLNQVKHDNYRHSLKLEGFTIGHSRLNLSAMNKQARDDLKAKLKKQYTKAGGGSRYEAG